MLNPFKLLSVPNWIKVIPVAVLWWSCSILDYIPIYSNNKIMFGCLGCYWGISKLAFGLEKKWGIDVDSLND